MEQLQLDLVLEHIRIFKEASPQGVVIFWWATTTWKTRLSLEVAQHLPLEVISADSRQVYTYMNIGTDKLSKEQQANVPHHAIDIITPDQTYTAGQRKELARKTIPEIQQRNKTPFVVGGTGLYIDMLYKNYAMPEVNPDEIFRKELYANEEKTPGRLYEKLQQVDPEEAHKHHPNSLPYLVRALEILHATGKTKTELASEKAVERPLLMIGLRREKEETNRKINKRIGEMMQEWLIEEVQRLLANGYTASAVAMQGIGYKEVVWYLAGEYDVEKAIELLKRNTHYLAKKQRTRFRRYIMDAKMNPKPGVTYKVFAVE